MTTPIETPSPRPASDDARGQEIARMDVNSVMMSHNGDLHGTGPAAWLLDAWRLWARTDADPSR